ncbi:ATP-binding cassette domain-containing protein [Tenggerimyces flavus]|uniref:ATP-binding cassette domain-containing protein n=1 Tax=Tenggerimyces flavus TaxID=1708749 RepID=A0ABV7Y2X1_9ACTN|nr:ATP-binding cassette domain-containing protein [Tenggerimyces flavus]MBM7790706.1 ABC-2 type transport system ATP-binding protein [Tenggerimyces flavus]
MTDVITARNLSKRYGSVDAVSDVSFAVAEGEAFCLLGPNGAGKSTTIRMLATLTRPDGGSASVAGFDVRRQQRSVRASIGYVAQSAGTDDYLTGRENLLVQAAAQRLSRSKARPRVAELLDLVGLADAADRIVRTYSGGMRRRLEIAMGIVHEPRVLFLDEPTTGLDPEARATMWDEFRRMRIEQNLTVLLTTHYLEEADQLADRILIVGRGRVVASGTPESLKAGLAGDSVSVELTNGPSAEAAVGVLARIGLAAVTRDGAVLRAQVERGSRALPAILSVLEAAGLRVESAAVARPTLDDVYLHHAGRSFGEAVSR